jgi:hypothetical protein
VFARNLLAIGNGARYNQKKRFSGVRPKRFGRMIERRFVFSEFYIKMEEKTYDPA